jgi:PAS domain S-box-containing protein
MALESRLAEKVLDTEPADHQFRLLVDHVVDYAIFLLDPSGRIVSWNTGAQRIKGYAAAEAIGRHFSMFYSLTDRTLGVPAALLARAERDGRAEQEGWRIRKDGSRFWADVVITALRAPGGTLRGFAKVTRNMTERRESEESLREQRALLTKAAGDLLALTRRLVEAEEAERRRLARELHDRVGQTLSALGLNLNAALATLGADASGPIHERLIDSLALVESTAQTIEQVMADLRPPLLEEYGLGAALQRHADDFARRTGVAVAFDDSAKEGARSLRLEVAVGLFRIAQEALNNVAKHAAAKQVRMALSLQGLDAVLSIIDDGRGFDLAAAARQQRWGMRTMRERAEAAGGRIDVASAPGKGTSVVASVQIS